MDTWFSVSPVVAAVSVGPAGCEGVDAGDTATPTDDDSTGTVALSLTDDALLLTSLVSLLLFVQWSVEPADEHGLSRLLGI